MDIKNKIELWFPKILGKSFIIIESNDSFNCVAYSLDILTDWVWSNEKKWPQEIPRSLGVDGFRKLYELYGYIETKNSSYEVGFDKIAFYTKNGIATHAAKQFTNIWRSKLGCSVIIEHQLEWLTGTSEDAYGKVEFIMKRPSK